MQRGTVVRSLWLRQLAGPALCAVLLLTACAFIPRTYPRFDEAAAAEARVERDGWVARYAPGELREAAETLTRARLARDRVDDPAVVDHLTYLAIERISIAREAARLRAAMSRADLPIRGRRP